MSRDATNSHAGSGRSPVDVPALKASLVDQHTPFSCALACIESILRENGVIFSQKQMLEGLAKDFPDWKDAPGKIAPGDFEKVFATAGFPIDMSMPENPQDSINRFPGCCGAIIGCEKHWVIENCSRILEPNYHAVRLLQPSCDGFEVMNPGHPPVPSKIETWPIKDLIDRKTRSYLFFKKEAT